MKQALINFSYFVECVPGNFGPDCEFNCDSCMNGAVCDNRRKGCDCRPGWQGLLCNETCPQVSDVYHVANCKLQQGFFTGEDNSLLICCYLSQD